MICELSLIMDIEEETSLFERGFSLFELTRFEGVMLCRLKSNNEDVLVGKVVVSLKTKSQQNYNPLHVHEMPKPFSLKKLRT